MPEYTGRQKQIIESAIEIIANEGIQSLTIKRLSSAIGISEPAIYRHFQNKQEIIESILRYFANDSKDYLLRIVKSDSEPIEKIGAFFNFHLDTFARRPALAAVIFSEDIFQNDRQLAQSVLRIMEQSQKTVLKILQEASKDAGIRKDIPEEHLATMLIGTLRFLVNKWHLTKHDFDLVTEGDRLWGSLRRVLSSTE